MRIDMVTLFPEMFLGPFGDSITKRAIESGILDIHYLNFRDYSFDKHHQVDDPPFGGGRRQGMEAGAAFQGGQGFEGRNKGI